MELVLDIHNHTVASGHAYSTLQEYITEAKKTGLALIAITDHAPAMPNSVGEFYFSNFRVIPKEISDVKVMMGVELNILDTNGSIDLSERLLEQLRPVIASFHPPCYKYSRFDMSEEEKNDEITAAIMKVMDNKLIDILGHPGDPRFPFDLERVVNKSLETGTLLEINNSSLEPTSFRFGSYDKMLEMLCVCKKKKCPIIIGSDSHLALNVGKFDLTLDLLQKADFPSELVANTSIKKFMNLLGSKEDA